MESQGLVVKRTGTTVASVQCGGKLTRLLGTGSFA